MVKMDLELFRGFAAKQVAEVDMDLIEPLFWHIRHILCSDNDNYTHWFTAWNADIVQKPARKTGINENETPLMNFITSISIEPMMKLRILVDPRGVKRGALEGRRGASKKVPSKTPCLTSVPVTRSCKYLSDCFGTLILWIPQYHNTTPHHKLIPTTNSYQPQTHTNHKLTHVFQI